MVHHVVYILPLVQLCMWEMELMAFNTDVLCNLRITIYSESRFVG